MHRELRFHFYLVPFGWFRETQSKLNRQPQALWSVHILHSSMQQDSSESVHSNLWSTATQDHWDSTQPLIQCSAQARYPPSHKPQQIAVLWHCIHSFPVTKQLHTDAHLHSQYNRKLTGCCPHKVNCRVCPAHLSIAVICVPGGP